MEENGLIRAVVADAGLLLPEAGTVGLDKFSVDLWMAHTDEEYELAAERGGRVVCVEHRGKDVGCAVHHLGGLTKSQIFFLCRRVNFVGRFTAGKGTTCGEWTRVVNGKGEKGFFKANPATGWCPVRCDYCYLLGVPFGFQSLALNVGEFAQQVARRYEIGGRKGRIPIINLGETGGLLEWADYFGVPELVQAYLDAALDAGVRPYILTKRVMPGLRLKGVHVGISLNPALVMAQISFGASAPGELLDFLADAKVQGASTVIRWGPVIAFLDREYIGLAEAVHERGLGGGRFTVDLLRYSAGHPVIRPKDAVPVSFGFRAHKWQEWPSRQLMHLRKVRDLFPGAATLTGCKLDPAVAMDWVRQGVIDAMPCACWV